MTNPTNNAVVVRGLSRRFRGQVALDDVTLTIPTGSVFGLVGINGAGKTTLMRHLIGALRPQSGSVQVLGMDPIGDRIAVLRRVGYMTEEDSLPTWASVDEVLDFFRGIQPGWDDQYAGVLCELFRINRSAKLTALSKGQRARVALLAAIAHRPEVLLLDEPSSGLDPIARGDILEAVIRTVNEDGRTVLFSSHLLDEVDRVCDHVAMIHGGRIVQTIQLEALENDYEEIVCFAVEAIDRVLLQTELPAAFGWQGRDREWSAVIPRGQNVADKLFSIETRPISLSRWFAAQVQTLDQANLATPSHPPETAETGHA